MEAFEIVEKIIGHIAWPLAAYFILRQFRSEIRLLLKRIKTAKYKGMEIDLKEELKEIKSEAELAGITVYYPDSSFPDNSIKNIKEVPEWAFIQSWQEIENLIGDYYAKVSGLKSSRANISTALDFLQRQGTLDSEMVMLIKKLRSTRNLIVHNPKTEVTRGETIEWLGISKSVRDRLSSKLN